MLPALGNLTEIIRRTHTRFTEACDTRQFDLFIEQQTRNKDTEKQAAAFQAIEQFLADPDDVSLEI